MNSQLFFLLNLGIGVGFLVWFLSSRRPKPTQLRLRAGERNYGMSPQRAFAALDKNPSSTKLDANRSSMARANVYDFQAPTREGRVLNAFFLYNGHDWEAYEVLGLPAGAGITVVTERYQSLITKADKGQLEFYEAAYRAILKK